MEKTVDHFIAKLSDRARVLMIGGLAVIAHGLSRATKDVDIWLEPLDTVKKWSMVVVDLIEDFAKVEVFDMKNQQTIKLDEIEKVVERDGMIRILGLDRPLDIFRIPHNFIADDFDKVWERSTIDINRVRVPDEIDLLITKEETSRAQDVADISFLETKIRGRFSGFLKGCSYQDALSFFERYADHLTCKAVLENPNPSVRDLGMNLLKEWANEGDPFALDILDKKV